MTRELKLKDYLDKGGTQGAVAIRFGITQGAISKALSEQRDIRLIVDSDNNIHSGYELKPLGKKVNVA